MALRRDSWEQLPADEKIAYLSHFAVAHDVPFARFAEAARKMLGMTAGQEFPADVEGHLHRELVLSREQHARYGAHQGRADEMGASRTLEQVESSGKSEEPPSPRRRWKPSRTRS